MKTNNEGIPYLEIDSNTGVLKVLAKIDAEEIPELSLEFTVRATEGIDPFRSISDSVSLRIRDENDNFPLINGESTRDFEVTILESHRDELPSLEGFFVVDADMVSTNILLMYKYFKLFRVVIFSKFLYPLYCTISLMTS